MLLNDLEQHNLYAFRFTQEKKNLQVNSVLSLEMDKTVRKIRRRFIPSVNGMHHFFFWHVFGLVVIKLLKLLDRTMENRIS